MLLKSKYNINALLKDSGLNTEELIAECYEILSAIEYENNDSDSFETIQFINKTTKDIIYNHFDYLSDYTQSIKYLETYEKLALTNSYNILILVPLITMSQLCEKYRPNENLYNKQLNKELRDVVARKKYSTDCSMNVLRDIVKDLLFNNCSSYDTFEYYTKLSNMSVIKQASDLMDTKLNSFNVKREVENCSLLDSLVDLCNKFKKVIEDDSKFSDLADLRDLFNSYKNLISGNTDNLTLDIHTFNLDYLENILCNTNEEDYMDEIKNLCDLYDGLEDSQRSPIAFPLAIVLYRKFEKQSLNLNISKVLKSKLYELMNVCKQFNCQDFKSALNVTDKLCSLTESSNYSVLALKSVKNNFVKDFVRRKLGTSVYENASIELDEGQLFNNLMEGFSIKKDGSIELLIPERNTFMDEYSENHRLMKYNHQLENYEGMKYNLVYFMLLANTIEKKVLYNKAVNDSDKEEAKRALRLIKGDLGVYLPIIKRIDPMFDLNKFYNKTKADKRTIEIDTVETIHGIRTILKAVMI